MDTDQSQIHDLIDEQAAGTTTPTRMEESHAALERAFIDEFLGERGYTLRTVERLPPAERERLLRAAAAGATLRLAEIEARAHYLDEIA